MKRYFIFSASKTKNLLHEIRLDSPISSTTTAANGVVYVTTMKTLYALEKK
jgi:putative pyrroloquinoline-quinone-binding quinoprotein